MIYEYTVSVEKIHLITLEQKDEPSFEQIVEEVKRQDRMNNGSLSTYNMRIVSENRRQVGED